MNYCSPGRGERHHHLARCDHGDVGSWSRFGHHCCSQTRTDSSSWSRDQCWLHAAHCGDPEDEQEIMKKSVFSKLCYFEGFVDVMIPDLSHTRSSWWWWLGGKINWNHLSWRRTSGACWWCWSLFWTHFAVLFWRNHPSIILLLWLVFTVCWVASRWWTAVSEWTMVTTAPVETVSVTWHDSVHCTLYNTDYRLMETSLKYRLPSSVQWRIT